MISITPSAIKEIKRIQSQKKTSSDTFTLKLAVSPGGCSGMFYDLSLVNMPLDPTEYHRLEIEGINLSINSESLDYIENLKLDYAEDLMGGGFRFYNPQITDICGCGISFGGQK